MRGVKLLAAILGAAIAAAPAYGAAGPGSLTRGKTLFVAACGSCHALAAARTHGRKGPNLNEEARGYADVVEQVVSGGGGMPAFRKSLTTRQIGDIARFVAHATAGAPADA